MKRTEDFCILDFSVDKPIPLLGQWLGYFEYSPEYGEELAGERVEFRLFVDDVRNYKL